MVHWDHSCLNEIKHSIVIQNIEKKFPKIIFYKERTEKYIDIAKPMIRQFTGKINLTKNIEMISPSELLLKRWHKTNTRFKNKWLPILNVGYSEKMEMSMCIAFWEANKIPTIHNKNIYCLWPNNYISVCLTCKMILMITINNVQRNNLNSPKLMNNNTNYWCICIE